MILNNSLDFRTQALKSVGLGILVASIFASSGCGNGASPGTFANPTNGTTLPPLSGPNVLQLTVNGSLCTIEYPDKPCVSVTVCAAGSTTNCQTISDILLDTGSFGLRVFGSVLNSAVLAGLTPVTVGGQAIAECTQYGDGSSDWGPVELANVILGTESPVQAPIQIIDSTYSNSSLYCSGADQNPAQAGYNGILGVGFFTQDCGPICTTQANNGNYFACTGSTCSSSTVPLANQVQNPVSLLPIDNNGVIVELPTVPSGGQASANGYLVLGIGTESNNTPSGVTAYTAAQQTAANAGNFTSTVNGTSYSSFLDSGSNGIFFPSALVNLYSNCGTTISADSGWYCPSSTQTMQATNIGISGGPSIGVQIQIANFVSLMNTGNNVFFNNGGSLGGGAVDWGLPFFIGRNVYVGFQGMASSLGTGPYWAY